MKKVLLFVALTINALTVLANEPVHAISFLTQQPVIDGVLDQHAASLRPREFVQFYDFDNRGPTPPNVTYRIGYTKSGVYFYIQTNANEVTYRKRGFVFGDGMKIILGKVNRFERSKEYVELVYSPTQIEADKVFSQYIQSVNVTGNARRLSSKSMMKEAVTTNSTGFEVFIHWDDINPYHYFFTPEIGINVYFAKGIINDQNEVATFGYGIKHDEGIWDEAVDHRILKPFRFIQPGLEQQHLVYKLANHTLLEKEPLKILFGGNITQLAGTAWKVKDEQGNEVLTGQFSDSALQPIKHIDLAKLSSGVYSLVVGELEKQFIILPQLSLQKTEVALLDNSEIDDGVRNTLLFNVKSIQKTLDALKPYESSQELLEQTTTLKTWLAALDTNKDPFEGLEKPYRRAFRSKLDGSMQPYTVKLPQNYVPTKRYPLLVFLHGSGRDEQGFLDQPRSNGEFIEIAPFGRDKYFAYGYKHSDIDIHEAIDDVIQHFSVDDKRIVIAGFSMGGYGALATYYRNPQRFAGVAVFAGHPNLANEWLDSETYPNFNQTPYLEAFSNTPVFIYHGTSDPALSFRLMQKLADNLETNGAIVTTSFVDGRGHVYQDPQTHNTYVNWLSQLVGE